MVDVKNLFKGSIYLCSAVLTGIYSIRIDSMVNILLSLMFQKFIGSIPVAILVSVILSVLGFRCIYKSLKQSSITYIEDKKGSVNFETER